jgi:pellino protein
LRDGTLIDLCGATLLWRSLDGFRASPTKKTLEEKIDMLNASRPQCPVGLNTLVIPRKPILPNANNHRSNHRHSRKDIQQGGGVKESGGVYGDDKSGHQPYVYLKCGHVQGYHDWGATSKMNQRKCPVCLTVGTVAKLSMGLEPSFYVDSGPLTHVFNPCGHMASEKTVRYWSTVQIPHGTHYFHSICPFCATPLTTTEPSTSKLIFQEGLD